MPANKKPDERQFKVGDKVRVNLHHGKIEDAIVRAVIQDGNEIKLQVDVKGCPMNSLWPSTARTRARKCRMSVETARLFPLIVPKYPLIHLGQRL